MKIIPLSEGVFTIDSTKLFVPFNISSDNLQQRPTGSLLVEIQPFVVVTSKDILLLDTGLGFEQNGKLQIYNNLQQHNILPGDITKVLLTHLHKDHAGGIGKKNSQGVYESAFPNANIYIQKNEYDYAFTKGFPSYKTEEMSFLENEKNIRFLNGDGSIDNYIEYKISGGHAPFHQVFWIKENNEIIFFGGDEAPQLQQMKNRFIAKYDDNGRKAMELRQTWWEESQQEKWTFLFYHDVKTPTFSHQ